MRMPTRTVEVQKRVLKIRHATSTLVAISVEENGTVFQLGMFDRNSLERLVVVLCATAMALPRRRRKLV